jgi:phosphoenolpyruvate synthase/pyruvate phosphate dikinase
MKIPNIKDYDFLWLIKNWTYFDTSFWIVKDYIKRDFIITCKGKDWVTYVSKEERKKLGKYGLYFFRKGFERYKEEVKRISSEARKFFKELKRKNLSELNDRELRKDFENTMKFTIKLWEPYFYTQYFMYDEIDKKIKQEKNSILDKKVKEMQKLKFEFRKLINKTMFQKEDYMFREYFKEIQKRTKRTDLYDLDYREIIQILKGKKIPKTIRKNYVIGKFTGWKPITGKKALEIIGKFDKKLIKKGQIIKGNIANKGYYKGKVRIINFDLKSDVVAEARKLKKGEVLVTGSTIPQMMTACYNAGAIVTEEGGITSHAAIVSREMNKPCVIGTKIATKVLKTGDIVIVDANKGIVKKVKSRK